MNKIHYIIFDLEGTLVNSFVAHYYSDLELYYDLGIKFDDKEWLELRKKDFYGIYEYIKRNKGLNIDLEEFKTRKIRYFLKYIHHIKGKDLYLYYLLYYLRSKRVKTYIASSSIYEVVLSILSYLNLIEFFDGIYTPDKTGTSDKFGLINYMLEKLNLEKNEVLVIEDNADLISKLKREGLFVIGFLSGVFSLGDLLRANPDYIVKNHEELYWLIRKLIV